MTFLSVIIPAYNEAARLPRTLDAVADFLRSLPGSAELLVVDDGSADNTAQGAEAFASQNPDLSVRVVSYGGNRGKGYAVRTGMLAAAGEMRLFIDADLATPMSEYEKVRDAMQAARAQVGIGSRPLRQSHLLVHQPLYRELLGRGFNKVVQRLGVPGISDTQCGFKLWTAEAAQSTFSVCRLDGFAFDAEALFVARRLGFSIAEVPVTWAHQPGSKVSVVRDGWKMLADMAKVRRLHRDLRPLSAPAAATLTPSQK